MYVWYSWRLDMLGMWKLIKVATSHAIASPSGSHVACVTGARLQIRFLKSWGIVRNIGCELRGARVVWGMAEDGTTSTGTTTSSRGITTSSGISPSSRTPPPSNRILVFDEDTTRVYDLRDEKWSAVISNGSGGMGKNVHVEFGASEDEVLIFSDFAACVKIWCLKTGRAVEIRDPKYSGKEGKGWGYRPMSRQGVLALLCRTSGIDILLLLAARTYEVLARTELPTTDAADLQWSRDGRWLAIWDAASAGYKLHIYTADGHLYRTLSREPSFSDNDAWGIQPLGIKSVQWMPGNARLAVGSWDSRVRILSTRTFAPVVYLDHAPEIAVPDCPVYTEHVSHGVRSYVLTLQPVTPPVAPLEKNETSLMKHGISIMSFTADATLCATKCDDTPSTVWIWDLSTLTPKTVLVHFAPVKKLVWYEKTLLVHTSLDAPITYLYNALSNTPEVLDLTEQFGALGTTTPRWTASWARAGVLVACQNSYLVVWPEGKEQVLRVEKDDEEEGEEDSLFDILTGKTPVPVLSGGNGDEDGDSTVSGLDDTFREKRQRGRESVSKEMEFSPLDESGMDEMF
jgi:hypothetical protein